MKNDSIPLKIDGALNKGDKVTMGELDSLAKRFTYLIEYMNLNQTTLSAEMGRKRSFVSNIANGYSQNPENGLYGYFEERFNVNSEWLAKGLGEPFLDGGPQDNFNLGKVVGLLNCLSDETYHAVMVILRELANRKFLEQIRKSSDVK